MHPGRNGPNRAWRWRAAKAAVFALCCLADAYVLRAVWFGGAIADGQFRRGYFERFDGAIGLAIDDAIRPAMLPAYVRTNRDELAVPPGMTAVAPLQSGSEYRVASQSGLAPYVVLGAEAPGVP